MKPTDVMWQMKALLPTDDRPGSYFMASFLLCLPSDMIDHLIAKDVKDCTKMAEYATLLYSSMAGNTVAAVNTEYKAAVNALSAGAAGSSRPTTGGGSAACRATRGAATERPPAHTRRTATFATSTLHKATRRRSANPGACGPWETGQQFMVDTGAVCSWGHIHRRLTFELRTFFVTFLLTAIYRPTLGLDFLSAHGLLVDQVCRQVLDSKTLKSLSKSKTAAAGGHAPNSS
jgi:hypothetical protein